VPGETWKLYAGDELVADLVVTDGDFPWLYADVREEPGFARFRPLFDKEVKASEAADWTSPTRRTTRSGSSCT
jgi:hypothetical protein